MGRLGQNNTRVNAKMATIKIRFQMAQCCECMTIFRYKSKAANHGKPCACECVCVNNKHWYDATAPWEHYHLMTRTATCRNESCEKEFKLVESGFTSFIRYEQGENDYCSKECEECECPGCYSVITEDNPPAECFKCDEKMCLECCSCSPVEGDNNIYCKRCAQEIMNNCDIEINNQQIVFAHYTVSSTFHIPMGVKLLSVEENLKVLSEENLKDDTLRPPLSWWIRYDELCYVGGDGEINVIEAFYSACEGNGNDFKRPDYCELDTRELEEADDESIGEKIDPSVSPPHSVSIK